MSITVLYICAAVVSLIAIAYGCAAFQLRGAVVEAARKVEWVDSTLEQAVQQIYSSEENEDTIIAGLQKIAQFNAPEIRAKVFRRVEELQRSSKINIAKHAEWTRDAIVRQEVLNKAIRADKILFR